MVAVGQAVGRGHWVTAISSALCSQVLPTKSELHRQRHKKSKVFGQQTFTKSFQRNVFLQHILQCQENDGTYFPCMILRKVDLDTDTFGFLNVRIS